MCATQTAYGLYHGSIAIFRDVKTQAVMNVVK